MPTKLQLKRLKTSASLLTCQLNNREAFSLSDIYILARYETAQKRLLASTKASQLGASPYTLQLHKRDLRCPDTFSLC